MGIRSKREGQHWEQALINRAYHEEILTIRLPEGCKRVGKNKLYQIKTPFDFILIKNKEAVFIDCKSCEKSSFTYSMITPHQIKEMYKINCEGLHAGYLVYFRELNEIVFFPASFLLTLEPRDSVTTEDGIYLGKLENFSLHKLFT